MRPFDKGVGARAGKEKMTMTMRWTLAIAGALALSFLTLSADLEWPFGRADAFTSGGEACPADARPANLNFTFKDLEGRRVDLASLKNKVILLDFWATWCGPCKVEIPWFVEFQEKYGPKGLQVVGIVLEDEFSRVKSFAEQMKMNYLVLDGTDRTDVEEAFGPLFGLPTTFVISRDAKICAKHAGLSSKSTFEREIAGLLGPAAP
ncbi:MAG: redoxin domain-containing protein [Acidobacteria bacterium]|nr:redoxin domain-containing protein [Acidobacteriota bacterium]